MKSLILAAAFAMFTLPAPLAAQGEAMLGPSTCAWKCVCSDGGCTCYKGAAGSGGKSCSAQGDGCTVAACDASALLLYEAADGSFATFDHAVVSDEDAVPSARRDWQVDDTGRSFLRTCDDIVIAQRFDPALANRLRIAAREIAI